MSGFGARLPRRNIPRTSADRIIADPLTGIGGGRICPDGDIRQFATDRWGRPQEAYANDIGITRGLRRMPRLFGSSADIINYLEHHPQAEGLAEKSIV